MWEKIQCLILKPFLIAFLLTNTSCSAFSKSKGPQEHSVSPAVESVSTSTTPDAATETPALPPAPPPAPNGCIWNWNRQSQPELSLSLETLLEEAGLPAEKVSVYAYGEDCFDPETLELRYFAAMETDFEITIVLDSLRQNEEAGVLLRSVLQALQSYPVENTPGPNPGFVRIQFITDNSSLNFQFNYTEGMEAINQDLGDDELLEHFSAIGR